MAGGERAVDLSQLAVHVQIDMREQLSPLDLRVRRSHEIDRGLPPRRSIGLHDNPVRDFTTGFVVVVGRSDEPFEVLAENSVPVILDALVVALRPPVAPRALCSTFAKSDEPVDDNSDYGADQQKPYCRRSSSDGVGARGDGPGLLIASTIGLCSCSTTTRPAVPMEELHRNSRDADGHPTRCISRGVRHPATASHHRHGRWPA